MCLVSNNLVQEAKEEEGKIMENRARNLREAERRAEILFLSEEQNFWMKQLWRVFKITISFLLVFFTSIVLIVSRSLASNCSHSLTHDLIARNYQPHDPNIRLHLSTPI